MDKLYLKITKGENVVYVKTIKEVISYLYDMYIPHGCKIDSISEKEYLEGCIIEGEGYDLTNINVAKDILE